jgi:hypothetical protein
VLDITMPKPRLQRSRVMASIRQRVTARMSQDGGIFARSPNREINV